MIPDYGSFNRNMYIVCSVYLFTTSFIRKINTRSGTYLAEVENHRVNGKVKQQFIRYIGKDVNAVAVRRIASNNLRIMEVRRSLDVEAVHRISKKLGINDLVPKDALVLVYSQLLDRPAINRMEQYLEETEILHFIGIPAIKTADLYDALTELGERDFNEIENKLGSLFLGIEKERKTVIIDVTDTYFTGDSLDSEPRKGKEGRIKKLVQIALVVTEKHGFPLMHRTYGGNINNRKIFNDLTKDLFFRGYTSILMDRGMVDTGRLKDLTAMGFSIIAGVRKSQDLKDMIDRIPRDSIYSKDNRIKLRNTTVFCREVEYGSGRMIVVFNPEFEAMKRTHYYEHSGDESVARYLGYSLIFHNTDLSTREVVRKYFDKDTVERAFRQIKGVLDLRPVRVWLKSHIESHIKICYLAYAILAYLDFILLGREISGGEALERLRSGYRVHLKDEKSGFEWDSLVDLKKEQREIMDVVIKKT